MSRWPTPQPLHQRLPPDPYAPLEEVAREIGGSIIASEDCIRAAGDPEWSMRFQSSREIQLRG